MATQNDFAFGSTWVDICAAIPTMASVDVLIANIDNGECFVVKGGASAPTGKTGIPLDYGSSVQLNDANIWLRSTSSGAVSATIL